MGKKIKVRKRVAIPIGILLVLILALAAVIGSLYSKQDELIQEVISDLNENFRGKLELGGTHISPFTNFPYISIDLENIKVHENKSDSSEVLLNIKDCYIGFDIWSIINGQYNIKQVSLSDGFLKIVQHTDGTFNLMNALSSLEEDTELEEEDSEALHLDLQSIRLINIDLLKLNEENNVLVEAFIGDAISSFKTSKEGVAAELDTEFTFNLILDNDTSFLHHKSVELNTTFDYDAETNLLTLDPSELLVEKVLFLMEGSVDVDDDMNLDLHFKGNKPNFDLFLAFAPEELEPALNRYDNGGRIYFDALIKGKSINGHNPKIDIDFGCKEAFVQNTQSNKTVNDLFFEGHFTNGVSRDPSTMSLTINDFSATPETGTFEGTLAINNFDSPEIELQLISNFNLDFLVEFLEVENLEDVSGAVSLEMNFHDIIDLSQPERSIERLNESYFTRLDVENLSFRSTEFPLAVSDMNIHGEMDGHEAVISRFDLKLGESDIAFKMRISDLPAILHHTDQVVDADLDIKSKMIDLREITGNNTDSLKGINEKIRDLSMHFSFKSSAKAFTESPYLPLGEFFIDRLYADFDNYPHKIHDFHADVMIDSTNFKIIDFTGMIDESDFHFNGNLKHFDIWFKEDPVGNTIIDFDLDSKLLQLEDLFTFGGENYVPEDYRHEEFTNLRFHGHTEMVFDKELIKTRLAIDHLESNMKVHDFRFENFSANILMDSNHLEIQNFKGRLGNSDLDVDLFYYFKDQDKYNEFNLRSERLDFDQLFSYNPPPADKELTPQDHEDVFNIFEVPFSNMNFNLEIGHLNYHRYLLDRFVMKGRTQKNHFIYLDTMSLMAAGGKMDISGYFNGSDPKAIYFSPNMKMDHIDLDKLLFKFENFGQDYLVSENLHGQISGDLSGKIHMHADMTPIINDSELVMDLSVFNGSINNYGPFEALSDYFIDKNLSMVRFDTLQNQLEMKEGTLTIPNMTINSSIGFMQISGTQDMDDDMDMEYYMRIPLKLVTQTGFKKLFGKKEEVKADQVDAIQYQDTDEKTRFINLKIEGNPDEYKVSLGKDKN